MTRAERAVLDTLAGQRPFLSAQDIHGRLREAGSTVGLTSVYRAVQSLRERGEIDETRRPGGEVGYRRCPAAHHHHLTCERCGDTVEVDAPEAERALAALAAQRGWTATGHTIEIVGLCGGCAAAAR